MTRANAAIATGLLTARRAFLGQLATLPLIGGAVTLIGQPSGVAEPVTEQLMVEYSAWLGYEYDRITSELYGDRCREAQRYRIHAGPAYAFQRGQRSTKNEGDAFGFWSPPASSRAALVLSAVGCEWRTSDLLARAIRATADDRGKA